jgi:hypothetical protein
MTDTTPAARPTLDPQQQSALLNAEVAKFASQGWTVSSVSGAQAVLQRKRRIGWFWNIVLSLVTGGIWLLVVLYKVLNRKVETLVLTADAYGTITRSGV